MAQILIVDDEGKMRALLAMALDSEGYSVDEAESAEAALEKIAFSGQPQVMITDIRLPGKSGLELLNAVKGGHPEVECIVITAFADAKTGIEAMRAGALEYMAKPFEMDEMLLLVRSAIDKNSLQKEVFSLRESAQNRFKMKNIVSASKAMRTLLRRPKWWLPVIL